MWTDDGMMYEVVDLKFSNGLELKGVKNLGGSYETSETVSASDLAGGLRKVIIRHLESGKEDEVTNLWLESCDALPDGKGTRIVMRELGYFERQELQLKSNVEYLAMMMGVEL